MPIIVIPSSTGANNVFVNADTGRNLVLSGIGGANSLLLTGLKETIPHNSQNGLQGGLAGQYYHLNSGQYFNLVTGNVVRPSETGVFVTQSQTGQFYAASNPSGFITGVDLSGYVTGEVVRPSETGIFITQSQTGAFYPTSNPSGFITGINNIVYTTGDQNISGVKTFADNVGIGTTSPSAELHAVSTTEQLRLGYDASNYLSTTVNASGLVTLDAVGSGAAFAFNDPVTATAQPVLSALTNTHLITRKHDRFLTAYKSIDMLRYAWAAQATNGSNSLSQDAYALMLIGGNGTLAGGITASARNHVSVGPEAIIGNVPASPYGGISFSAPMVIHVGLRSGGGSGWDVVGTSGAIAIGSFDANPTHLTTTLHPTNTISTAGYVTLLLQGGNVYLKTQVGNGAVVTSAVLDTYTNSFGKHYSIVIESGTAYLYSNGTLLGSVVGCPAGSIGGGTGGLFANIYSTTGTPTNNIRLYVQYLNITWD